MRIWATAVLASFGLISGVIASEPSNTTSVLAQLATPSPGLTNANQITIGSAEFGFKRVDSSGKSTFFPTTRVPLQQRNAYGWRITLEDYQGEVKWREVLRLPKAPETWGTENGEDFLISADGTIAITKRAQLASDGVIQNYWTIAPGDPVGKYTIQVYIDDRLVKTFDFELVPTDNQQSEGRI